MNCENGYAYLIFFQHFFGYLLPLTAIFILQLITMSLKKTSKEGLVVSFLKSSTIGGTTTNSTGDRNSLLITNSVTFEGAYTRSKSLKSKAGSLHIQTGRKTTLAGQQQLFADVGDISLFDDLVSPRSII